MPDRELASGDGEPLLVLDGLTKEDARVVAARRRDILQSERVAAAKALAAWPPSDLFAQKNKIVSGYWPMRSEMDPRPLLVRFANHGLRLALPRVPAGGARLPLAFHLWAPGDPLARGPFGLSEPHAEAPTVDPDILLTPLLAFDRAGRRLGYGGGYYDRTLEALRSRKAVLAVGVAFAGQEANRVPSNSHDQFLDAVVTERGWLAVSGPREAGEAPDIAYDSETE